MKKVLVMALAISLGVQVSYGQTWNEWFRQKKTQIEYLVKQIAALRVYADYLHKGYTIVKNGTHIISDIKQGDFDLHKRYFTSLKFVHPAIKNYSKVAIILSDQATILHQFRELSKFCRESKMISAAEQSYISSVSSKLKEESVNSIDDLLMVLTSGELEMKDDERLQRIDKIYEDAKEQLSFALSFCKQAISLAYQRIRAAREIDLLRKIYGDQ